MKKTVVQNVMLCSLVDGLQHSRGERAVSIFRT